jgi:hypothetical protein
MRRLAQVFRRSRSLSSSWCISWFRGTFRSACLTPCTTSMTSLKTSLSAAIAPWGGGVSMDVQAPFTKKVREPLELMLACVVNRYFQDPDAKVTRAFRNAKASGNPHPGIRPRAVRPNRVRQSSSPKGVRALAATLRERANSSTGRDACGYPWSENWTCPQVCPVGTKLARSLGQPDGQNPPGWCLGYNGVIYLSTNARRRKERLRYADQSEGGE